MKQRELLSTLGKPGPFSPSVSQNEHNEVLSEVLQPLTTLEEQLDNLAQTRRKLHRSIQHGKRDLAVRLCSREYMPALAEIEATYPRDVLETERDTLTERLNRGIDMGSTPSINRTFQKLLTRYEVIEDCLSDHVMTSTFERIERWAA